MRTTGTGDGAASGRLPRATVIGSGPNGLAAAVALATAGLRVHVVEAHERIGGGARTAELTVPGFRHDVCSAVHPLGIGSPYFRTLPLGRFGLEWIHPPLPLAHPLDDGPPMVLARSLETTAASLGVDAAAWRRLFAPLVASWESLSGAFLGPLLRIPEDPLPLLRLGLHGLISAGSLAGSRFRGPRARALFAGCAAHSMLPLEKSPSAAFGLVLAAAAHAVGWPIPRGGSGRITEALAACLVARGGSIETGRRIDSVFASPRADSRLSLAPRAGTFSLAPRGEIHDRSGDSDLLFLDLSPREALRLAAALFPAAYRRLLARYRYGPGVCKLDWALRGPIPWRHLACAMAGTVHLGGTYEEIAAAERSVSEGRLPAHPFVILAQPSLFDPSRAAAGAHTAWAYCHVPSGSTADLTDRIEAQVERFAPGFRRRVLARSVFRATDLEAYNPNYVGGDINGGLHDLWQLAARPALRPSPYVAPVPGVYLCSASTPPGGGVHGMCGYHAARVALARMRRAGP